MRNAPGWTQLFGKLLLFALPFIVILGSPAVLMVKSGELTSVDKVMAKQLSAKTQVLFGRAYTDPTAYYKLESVRQRNVEVMALGTSRVLALRANFFRDDVEFFNAGNGITRLGHLRPFLRKLPPERTPKVIILGVDQYFLNGNFDPLTADDMESQWAFDRKPHTTFFANWLQMYRDYAADKIRIDRLIKSTEEQRFGISARIHTNAFRNDGSYHWGQHITDPEHVQYRDVDFRLTLDRIAKGNGRFQYARHLTEANAAELERFLADCHARGIYVIGFLPPFAHAIYEKMRSMPEQYGYLAEVPVRGKQIFERYGYQLFDFSDLATVGATDKETIDGFHGTEKAYLRLFLQMVQADPTLAGLARDSSELRARINHASGHHLVFGLNE
jgi:hypothetical protein